MTRFRSVYIISFVIISSIMMSLLVAQGRLRSIVIIITAILFIIMVTVDKRIKFWLFLAGIFLSLFAPVMMPYGITLGEILLAALFVDLFIEEILENHSSLAIKRIVKSIPFVLFAGYSLIVNMMHGDFAYWHGVSFVPLVCVYISMTLVENEKRAWAVVKIALLVILGFLFLLLLADITGRIVITSGEAWRLGGVKFAFGPLVYQLYSVHLGGLVSLGVPALILMLMRSKVRWYFRFIYGALIIICFIILVLTAARGPFIGALVAAALTILLSFRLRKVAIFLMVIAILIIFILPFWTLIFPAKNILLSLARFSELQNLNTVDTFIYRQNIYAVTLKRVMQNPFGYGYDYLWNKYGFIDEANIYTPLINGTGIIGFALFVIMLCQLAWTFLSAFLRANNELLHDFAILGICTLVAELISGISAHNIIIWPRDSIVFWAILSACYAFMLNNRQKISQGFQKAKERLS